MRGKQLIKQILNMNSHISTRCEKKFLVQTKNDKVYKVLMKNP